MTASHEPAFYTVREAAAELRLDRATRWAIREGGFPAVRIRSGYIVPRNAVQALVDEAATSGGLVDPGEVATRRRAARALGNRAPEWS